MLPTSAMLSAALQISISMWDFRGHSFWAWLFIGLVAGWLAGVAFRGRGFGCVTDIIFGMVGSVIGGWLFNYFGVMNGDFYYSLAAAALGAMILVGISRLFSSDAKK
jgi:uncharacterized membrane protein YeaQ/YmgE (transglycosylase-associated protein family)